MIQNKVALRAPPNRERMVIRSYGVAKVGIPVHKHQDLVRAFVLPRLKHPSSVKNTCSSRTVAVEREMGEKGEEKEGGRERGRKRGRGVKNTCSSRRVAVAPARLPAK